MTEKRWYVVAYDDRQEDPDNTVWTVSRNPDETGWETDMGCGGYGLTKADAEELADAANNAHRQREIDALHAAEDERDESLMGAEAIPTRRSHDFDFLKGFIERHAPRSGYLGRTKQERVAEFVADLTILVQLREGGLRIIPVSDRSDLKVGDPVMPIVAASAKAKGETE